MKQKLLLALLALFTLGWTNARAQSWTASEVGEGYFMLYNVGTGQYLTRGNGWGTQATITTGNAVGNGISVQLQAFDGKYKIRTNINGDGNGLENLSGGTVYTDQSSNKNSTWTFTQVTTDNGPVYNIVSADNHGGGTGAYLTAGADGTKVTPGTDGAIDGAKWKLMAFPAQPVGMNEASETNPVDATSLIVNPNFSFDAIKKGDGWTMQSSNYNPCGGNVSGTDVVYNPCAESWRASFTLSQALTVPNGIYELTAQAAVTEYTVTGADMPVVYANDVTTPFKAMTKGESSMAAVATNFTNGDYTVNSIRVVVTNGSLTIGVRGTRTDTWCCWDNFKLTYKGVDLTALKEALQAQIDAVAALEGTTTAAAYNAAKNYADGINMDALTTEEAISTASTELAALVDAAKALQPSYSRYAAIRDAALAISANVDLPDVESATTAADIDAAIPTLRANFLAELPNVTIPADPGYIDVTAVMVDNASVRQNTDYWTIEGTPNGNNSFGKCAYNECEFYGANFKFYQTLALTPGTWEFGVTGFHRGGQGEFNTDFYAGVDKISIPGVESSVVNSMAAAETYFNNGNGKVALKFLIEEADNVEIGIDNQDTQTDKWTIFRDFTLKYYGAPDYSVYDTQWEEAVAAANAAIAANPIVAGEELTAVQTAIHDAPDGSSKANYLEKINALTEATATLIAAAPAYNAYAAEKVIAQMIGATPGDDPTSAAAAIAGVENLKVAEFTYVNTEYPYDYQGVIGDFGTWTGTATVGENNDPAEPNYLTNEHWSGESRAYYEQAATGWGNAGGWTIKYEKTAKLPAGDYMLKVAARSSVDVTSLISCTATTNTVTLPNKGNSGRGIAKNGNASFADSDEFIPSAAGVANAGAGWEWRFLPFSLTEETEVTMTFYAETNKQYNWMSIADGTLLSKQEIQNEVELTDADEAAPEAQVATSVITDRKLLEGLNTVIFPFETTATELGATTVLAYTGTTEEADGLTLNFKEVAPVDGKITLQANTPYAVMVDADQTENLAFGTKNISPSGELTVTDANNEFNFVGTYTNLAKGNEVVVEGDYVAGATAFKKAKGGNRIAAYRAYLKKVGTSNVANVKFNFGGDVVDGIEALELLNKFSADGIFNLQGQKVNNAQKGVYIVNGKKIVVK